MKSLKVLKMAWGLMNTLISSLQSCQGLWVVLISSGSFCPLVSGVLRKGCRATVWLSVPPPPLFSFPLGLPARREELLASSQSLILPLIHCQQQESQSYECVCSFWMCELPALVAILSHNTWHKIPVCALRICSAWACHGATDCTNCDLYNSFHSEIWLWCLGLTVIECLSLLHCGAHTVNAGLNLTVVLSL